MTTSLSPGFVCFPPRSVTDQEKSLAIFEPKRIGVATADCCNVGATLLNGL